MAAQRTPPAMHALARPSCSRTRSSSGLCTATTLASWSHGGDGVLLLAQWRSRPEQSGLLDSHTHTACLFKCSSANMDMCIAVEVSVFHAIRI